MEGMVKGTHCVVKAIQRIHSAKQLFCKKNISTPFPTPLPSNSMFRIMILYNIFFGLIIDLTLHCWEGEFFPLKNSQ